MQKQSKIAGMKSMGVELDDEWEEDDDDMGMDHDIGDMMLNQGDYYGN